MMMEVEWEWIQSADVTLKGSLNVPLPFTFCMQTQWMTWKADFVRKRETRKLERYVFLCWQVYLVRSQSMSYTRNT